MLEKGIEASLRKENCEILHSGSYVPRVCISFRRKVSLTPKHPYERILSDHLPKHVTNKFPEHKSLS